MQVGVAGRRTGSRRDHRRRQCFVMRASEATRAAVVVRRRATPAKRHTRFALHGQTHPADRGRRIARGRTRAVAMHRSTRVDDAHRVLRAVVVMRARVVRVCAVSRKSVRRRLVGRLRAERASQFASWHRRRYRDDVGAIVLSARLRSDGLACTRTALRQINKKNYGIDDCRANAGVFLRTPFHRLRGGSSRADILLDGWTSVDARAACVSRAAFVQCASRPARAVFVHVVVAHRKLVDTAGRQE